MLVSSASSRMQTLGMRFVVVADFHIVIFISEGLAGGVRKEACGSKRRRKKEGGKEEGGESELTLE